MVDFSRRGFLFAAPAFIVASRLDFGVPKKLIQPKLVQWPVGSMSFVDDPASLFGGVWRNLGLPRNPGVRATRTLWERIE